MSSVQERLQLKRVPLDSWSIREKLSLASVVACSGDQNWMTVSRALKTLCGGDRPSDWFSQKSCAAQYGKLLENVATPKRKKRTEKDNSQTSAAETPAELILRDLRQERMEELDSLISVDEDQYKKEKEDILEIQSKKLDIERLQELWAYITQEQKTKQKEQLERKQWLEQREERKMEHERAWRPAHFFQSAANQSPSKPSHLNIKINSNEDMDIDDSNSKQGTSPLLTSLLKSPSPAPNPGTLLHTSISSPNNNRVTAPTITNLLTGTISNIPVSVQHQSFPVQMPSLTPSMHFEQSNVVQSPSQAAPTLSMLLESKFKDSPQKIPPLARIDSGTFRQQDSSQFQQQIDVNIVPKNLFPVNNVVDNVDPGGTKDEDQQLMDVFNGLIPDNIDELADILTENNVILNPELLEEDEILENVESLMDVEQQNDDMEKLSQDEPKIQGFSDEQLMCVDAQEGDSNQLTADGELNQPKPNSPTPDRMSESRPISDLKEEDQSDFSNDVPLSELFKCNQTTSQVKQPTEDEATPRTKEPDVFESDSNDDQCLESIKREIQGLSGLKENSDNSNEETDHQPKFLDGNESTDRFPVTENPKEESITEEVEEPVTEATDEGEDKRMTETVEVVEIKDDKCEEEKTDAVIVLEETDDANSEATVSDEGKMEVASAKDDEQMEANKLKSRTESTDDDDMFEDSKDLVEDVMPDDNPTTVTAEKSAERTVNIIDTDDDSPIEVIREDKSGKVKRDYSRKKTDNSTTEKRIDVIPEDNKQLTRVKERDRSESPYIDDDAESKSSSRRSRSTPVLDSLPNSPASTDDHEYRTWKKSILLVYNQVYSHKYASIFQKQIPDDKKADYRSYIHYPMDLHTIKRNIESGKCRTTIEFQNDIALMCYNAIIYNCNDSVTRDMAVEMRDFAFSAVETIMETWKKENEKTSSSPGVKMTRKRKNRLPAV
ncbi:Bromodomain-containing protein 8 [Pseudolycoriella hygida]|uniref:Bromodomain-containing protein 8 n=1 Tax=Pseudolycoriella hygida TaxID=35572 RepID=A0A9Q0MTX3_9DIPT|nr:Bromodomain-containing protein 8 [Pseudolycoriella hygida]